MQPAARVIVLFIVGGFFVLAIVIIVLMMYNAQRLSDFTCYHDQFSAERQSYSLIVTMQIIVPVNDNHRDLEGATFHLTGDSSTR